MKDLGFKYMIGFAFALRFLVCIAILPWGVALAYTLLFVSFYYFIKNLNVGYTIALVMLDYLFMFALVKESMGANIYSLLISVFAFVLMNSVLYIVLINKIGSETSPRRMKGKSEVCIDNGLKAMQDNDLDIAIDEFKNAIKNYKKNYLGYMGMCDVLAKSNKKHLKKFKYYKKKCIKYAPSELKENIVRRYE